MGFTGCLAVKNLPTNVGDLGSIPGLGRSAGEGIEYPPPVFLGFPCGSAGKESNCNAGGLGSIPGSGRPPGEGKGDPLQYSGLENYSPWGCKELDTLSNFQTFKKLPSSIPCFVA